MAKDRKNDLVILGLLAHEDFAGHVKFVRHSHLSDGDACYDEITS